MICPKCDSTVKDAPFCAECGFSLPQPPDTCPNCHAKTTKSRFCPECGVQIGEDLTGELNVYLIEVDFDQMIHLEGPRREKREEYPWILPEHCGLPNASSNFFYNLPVGSWEVSFGAWKTTVRIRPGECTELKWPEH